MKREIVILAAALLGSQSLAAGASADNKMSYKLETPAQASSLTKAGGSLGMKVGPKDDITSEGLTFQVLTVEGVVGDSPAAQAGFKVGDQIIAVDGHVFPNPGRSRNTSARSSRASRSTSTTCRRAAGRRMPSALR